MCSLITNNQNTSTCLCSYLWSFRTWRSSASSSVWITWPRWPRLPPSGRLTATCSKISYAEPAAAEPLGTNRDPPGGFAHAEAATLGVISQRTSSLPGDPHTIRTGGYLKIIAVTIKTVCHLISDQNKCSLPDSDILKWQSRADKSWHRTVTVVFPQCLLGNE